MPPQTEPVRRVLARCVSAECKKCPGEMHIRDEQLHCLPAGIPQHLICTHECHHRSPAPPEQTEDTGTVIRDLEGDGLPPRPDPRRSALDQELRSLG